MNVTLDNNIGGIQNRILMVGLGLRNYGIETVIVAPNTKGRFSTQAREKGFKVYQASIESPKFFNSPRGLCKNILWLLHFPFACIRIIKIIKQERIDIIHLNGLLNLQAFIAAKIAGKTIAWHLISTIYPSLIVGLIRPFYANIQRGSPVLLAQNLQTYYFGRNNPKTRPVIVHEPVDTDYFDRDKITNTEIDQFRRLLRARENEKIVGIIGNINPQKGLECFIKTVKEINVKKASGIRYFIIGGVSKGSEDYYSRLTRLLRELDLENIISFIDRIPDIRPAYALIDIFLLTSISEGTPLSILEAMSMQKAIVAVDVGGISEQIENGVSGFVNNRDPLTLAQIVINLLDNPELMKEMGKNARERAINYFSIDGCIKNHIRLYDELLGS